VKQYCGTSSHRIHPKGRDAFQCQAFWRISQSCNDDFPHILALPDLGDSTVADKVLLLHFDGKPFGDWMPSDRNELKAKIDQALPGYVHHLVNMPVQQELWGDRFGQLPYKNPIAMQKYFNLTQEAGLLELIDKTLFSSLKVNVAGAKSIRTRGYFKGHAAELEKQLQNYNADHELEKIGATGHMMGRMLHAIRANPSTEDRIRITKRGGRSFYYVFPPQDKRPPFQQGVKWGRCDEK
jgi:hypothetical protein